MFKMQAIFLQAEFFRKIKIFHGDKAVLIIISFADNILP